MIAGGTVYLVDDDFDVREGLTVLMRTHGLDVTAFDGGIAFLEALPTLAPLSAQLLTA